MKLIITLFVLLLNFSVLACETKGPNLMIVFDGLGTSELGLRVMERHFVAPIKRKCPSLHSETYHYGEQGRQKARACLIKHQRTFGNRLRVHVAGHSFGAGIGSMLLLKEIRDLDLRIENVVLFDARDMSTDRQYRRNRNETLYQKDSQVEHLINVYQARPLRGYKVAGADVELNYTGRTTHVRLPKKARDEVYQQLIGALSCAR